MFSHVGAVCMYTWTQQCNNIENLHVVVKKEFQFTTKLLRENQFDFTPPISVSGQIYNNSHAYYYVYQLGVPCPRISLPWDRVRFLAMTARGRGGGKRSFPVVPPLTANECVCRFTRSLFFSYVAHIYHF